MPFPLYRTSVRYNGPVRWDHLTLAQEPDPDALFGVGEVVTRTVDTPEFRGLTFYEVRARSIINKVPAASRMPFTWTVNPYRGCSHACRYCLAGDTPILLASGRTSPLSQLRCGQAIYGTVRDGSVRRYVLTEVLAHWRSVKRAYRLRLADGRELVTSGDHRFLTGRGWQQVSDGGNGGGGTQRGCLSRGDQLMGMELRRDYRYLLGKESFRAATVPADRWVQLWGGLHEQIRSCHTVDPVSGWPGSLIGTEVDSAASLAVVEVEDLGMSLPMYDITTGTGDFIANGVVSHNCFARRTHEYLDLDSGRDFDTKIVVKVNAPELLRQELSGAHWAGDHIAMGTNVDPYQRAEGRYRLMPGILEALRDARNPFSILTKGTLVLRDLTLLRAAARVTDVRVNISVGFIDEGLWRQVEPGTPAPRARLGVCRALTAAGIGCGVLMAPIPPYLTDSPGQLEETVRALADAGARSITPVVLHLRPGAREWYLAWLQREYPELVGSYRQLYGRGAYAPKTYQHGITTQVAELARRYEVGRRAGERPSRGSFRRVRAGADPPQEKRSLQGGAGAEQLPLL